MNFGHHPDPAVDFCLEVEAIENDLTDRAAGLQPQITDIGARIDRAMQFKVGGDTGAVVAKTSLRTIEQAFKAGAACGVPASEPLRHATKENGDCPHWCRACAAEAATRGVSRSDDKTTKDGRTT